MGALHMCLWMGHVSTDGTLPHFVTIFVFVLEEIKTLYYIHVPTNLLQPHVVIKSDNRKNTRKKHVSMDGTDKNLKLGTCTQY
jgi:hypothetical protein